MTPLWIPAVFFVLGVLVATLPWLPATGVVVVALVIALVLSIDFDSPRPSRGLRP